MKLFQFQTFEPKEIYQGFKMGLSGFEPESLAIYNELTQTLGSTRAQPKARRMTILAREAAKSLRSRKATSHEATLKPR